MQDLVWLLYIALWIASARFASGTRLPVPRVFELDGVAYVADQGPLGCMMALFCAGGALAGVVEPVQIYNAFLATPDRLDGVGRLAQIVGGVCGAYVGVRAVRLWILLFLAWVAFQALSYLVGYVTHG